MTDKKPFNPIKILWNIISTVSGAIGLISLAEDWADWGEKIQEIVAAYRGIVHWPFKWLCIEVANWVKDYFFMSFLFTGSLMKSETGRIPRENTIKYIMTWVTFYFMLIVLWPLIFMLYCYSLIVTASLKTSIKESDKSFRAYIHEVFLWFSASIILFLTILLFTVLF